MCRMVKAEGSAVGDEGDERRNEALGLEVGVGDDWGEGVASRQSGWQGELRPICQGQPSPAQPRN